MNLKNKILSNQGYLVIGVILIVSVIGFYRTYIVEKNGEYTIATVYNIKGARSRRSFNFSYSFRGKEYKSKASGADIYLSDEGSRFFIQVLANDPSRCFMTDIRVPDFISEAPYYGWKELPIDVP